MKKLLSILMTCCLFFSCIPMTAYAEEADNGVVGLSGTTSVNEVYTDTVDNSVEEETESNATDGTVDEPVGNEVDKKPADNETTDIADGEEGGNEPVGGADGTGADTGVADMAGREEVAEPEGIYVDMPTEQVDADMGSGDGTVVSRVQWLHELTALFDMNVDEKDYPDNYYSDIDVSSPYYPDVMLATEFGLVDVEAGEDFRPEEPATREFAAHTLNLCLGFAATDETYTFSDAADTAYAVDIQIALDRGWFTLSNGHALPKAALAVKEKEIMLSDAAAVLETVKIDSSHNNQYEFAEGVIVLPEETVAELVDENEMIIYDCPVMLQAGDRFAIVAYGFPVVRKAVNVINNNGNLTVTTESVDMEQAFKNIDIQGSLRVDLTKVQSDDPDVSVTYIVGGTEENNWEDGRKFDDVSRVQAEDVSAVEVIREYEIPEIVRAEYNLDDGMKATLSYNLSDVKVDYSCSLSNPFVSVSGKATFSCNVSIDVLVGLGIISDIPEVRVPVLLIGYWELRPDVSLKGDATVYLEEDITLGIQYNRNSGFRCISDFSKKDPTVQAKADGTLGFRTAFGFDVGALKGSLYAEAGIKVNASYQTYNEGIPQQCSHVGAYFYANVGGNASANLWLYKDSWSKNISIYNEKNSPIRVGFHWEDGVPVSKCTRGTTEGNRSYGTGTVPWKYYTPIDSKYGYNGASGGIGANGESYTIFDYELDKAGDAVITGYYGNVSALNIPNILDGHTVTGIKENTFKGNTQLRVVIIPDSVTSIGSSAFSDCANLSSVTLSKGVTYIGKAAFYNCDKISSIEIPRSLERTGWYTWESGAFDNCDGLKTVTFEKGTTRVAPCLFAYCTGLEQIIIPDTVATIDSNAFHNCSNLTEVVIPESVTKIEDAAFEGCSKLSTIKIPDSVTSIGDSAFSGCGKLSVVKIPDSVTSIGDSAFSGCANLSSVTLSKGVTYIGKAAFLTVIR